MVTLEQMKDLHKDAREGALEPNIGTEERLARQNRVRLLGEEISRMLYPPIRTMEERQKKAKMEEEKQ